MRLVRLLLVTIGLGFGKENVGTIQLAHGLTPSYRDDHRITSTGGTTGKGVVFWSSKWTHDIEVGYQRRVQADPSFPIKSIAEIVLAVSTQLTAEIKNRGASHIVAQMDFVVPAILTAMAGKYMSMWKTAPTQISIQTIGTGTSSPNDTCREQQQLRFFGTSMDVPTNVFQRFLLDGITVPTLRQRLGSMLAPMWPLFRVGCLASALGYGSTAVLILLRTIYLPSYQSVTHTVNVLYATLYTGVFMAIVSNVRYQILQGMVEPIVDRILGRVPVVRGLFFLGIRIGNGLLGSMLAIAGMKVLGLQRLK